MRTTRITQVTKPIEFVKQVKGSREECEKELSKNKIWCAKSYLNALGIRTGVSGYMTNPWEGTLKDYVYVATKQKFRPKVEKRIVGEDGNKTTKFVKGREQTFWVYNIYRIDLEYITSLEQLPRTFKADLLI